MMDYDEQELKEAEALALALEGKRSADNALPSDALQTASLLRYSSNEGALSEEKQARIEQELLSAIDAQPAPATQGSARPSLLSRLFGPAGLALGGLAAAATFVLWTGNQEVSQLATSASEPSLEAAAAAGSSKTALTSVLAAQTQFAATPTPEALTELDDAMAGLRRQGLNTNESALDATFTEAIKELQAGQAQEALNLLKEPLANPSRASVFLANLYLVQGQAFGELGQLERSQGSYYEALKINEQLMREALSDEGTTNE